MSFSFSDNTNKQSGTQNTSGTTNTTQLGSTSSESQSNATSASTGTSTSTVGLPGATAGENALLGSGTNAALTQTGGIPAAFQYEAQTEGAPASLTANSINDAATQALLARLNGTAPVISPAALAQLNAAYGGAERLGLQTLDTQFGNDAAARGLAVTDSPVANAKALALANYESGLQSAKARDVLNYGQQEAGFDANMADYVNQLRQRALLNRLSLVNAGNPAAGLANTLFQQRFLTAPRSTTNTGNIANTGSVANTGTTMTSGTGASTGTANLAGITSGSGMNFGLSGGDAGGFMKGLGGLGVGGSGGVI